MPRLPRASGSFPLGNLDALCLFALLGIICVADPARTLFASLFPIPSARQFVHRSWLSSMQVLVHFNHLPGPRSCSGWSTTRRRHSTLDFSFLTRSWPRSRRSSRYLASMLEARERVKDLSPPLSQSMMMQQEGTAQFQSPMELPQLSPHDEDVAETMRGESGQRPPTNAAGSRNAQLRACRREAARISHGQATSVQQPRGER